jgi:hypothetical protein
LAQFRPRRVVGSDVLQFVGVFGGDFEAAAAAVH